MVTMADIRDKKVVYISLAIICVLLVIGIAGYGASRYLSKNDQMPTTTENTGKGIVSKFNKSEVSHSTVLPADLPAGSPIYADAELLDASSSLMGDEGKLFSLIFRTDENPEDVFAFYTRAFSVNGWKSHTTESTGDLRTIVASHAEKNIQATFTGPARGQGEADTSFQLMITVLNDPEIAQP